MLSPENGTSGLCGWVILVCPYCQHDSWQKSSVGGNTANRDQLLPVAKASVFYHCQRNSGFQALKEKKQRSLVDVISLVDSNKEPEPQGMERLNRGKRVFTHTHNKPNKRT